MTRNTHVVTGALGYSGRFIARRLLDAGLPVRTLTGSPEKHNPFGDRIEIQPLSFDDPSALAESMGDAAVLYNTYWVRFNHRHFGHAEAVDNTHTLFAAAKAAGVGRIVHVSITNPSLSSPFEYFRGKAQLEAALRDTGIPHSILRPAVLFGHDDILINNIAWMLRRLPIFGIFGDGAYELQPIHVDDFAELALAQGAATGNRIIDAIGPQTFTYRRLVAEIGTRIGAPRPLVSIPATLGAAIGWLLGHLIGDVLITKPEIDGLMAGLLATNAPPAGHTQLTDWLDANARIVGGRYHNELHRRRRELPRDVRGRKKAAPETL